MKKVLTGSVTALLVFLLSAGLGLAGNGKGNGKGGSGQGGNGGGTSVSIICSGTPIEFSGVVSDVSYGGSGMEVATDEIATDDGSVIVYGIGPYRYWDALEIDRPTIGDEVTVSGMQVDFNGTPRIVAISITVGGQNAQLRETCDALTGGGQPLWRGGFQKQGQQ
ncbi:MAG: hypothetical protein JRL30_05120 [Deltaproteobacteria bacterium]|nr:hypothetical protein [Deltaproteobacteria bacterium]